MAEQKMGISLYKYLTMATFHKDRTRQTIGGEENQASLLPTMTMMV